MPEHRIDLPASLLYDWIQRESEGHFVNFHVNARKEYVVPGGEVAGAGTTGAPDVPLLARGMLNIEPLVEQNYWVLRIEATRREERRGASDQAPSPVPDLTPEEFAAQFLDRPDAQTKVMLLVQTDEAKRAFDDWLRRLQEQHGAGGAAHARATRTGS